MNFDFDLRFRNTVVLVLNIMIILVCSRKMEANGPYDIPLEVNPIETLTTSQDTIPEKANIGKYLTSPDQKNPFDLKDPPLLQDEIDYDPQSNSYNFINRLGDDYAPYARTMTFSEFLDYRKQQQEREYFERISGIAPGGGLDLDPMDPSRDTIDLVSGGSNTCLFLSESS